MNNKEMVALAKDNGWKYMRRGKGSHELWCKKDKIVVIPFHPSRDIRDRLERALIVKLKKDF